MKTATIIFVALTVFSGLFLESSSAPSLSGGSHQNSLLGGVVGLVQNILGGFGNVFHKRHFDKLQKLADVKPELKVPLAGLLEKLKTSVINLLDAIKNGDVGDILKNHNLFKVAEKNIKTTLAQLLQTYGKDADLKYLLDEITKLVEDIITELVKQVKALLKELFDAIANGLAPQLNEVVARLLKLLDEALVGASGDVQVSLTKIKELLCKLLEIIGKINKAAPEAITTGIPDKVEALNADLESIIAELKQLLRADVPDVINNTLTTVIKLLEVILPELKGIIEIIKNLLDNVVMKVNALLDGLFGKLVGEPTKELRGTLKEIGEHILTLLTGIKNGNIVVIQEHEVLLCNLIKKVKAIIPCLLEKLGDGVKELLDEVLQVVEKIVNIILKELKPIFKKLVNGVKDNISALTKDLPGILKKIKEDLADADAKGKLKELLINIEGLLKKLLEQLLDLIKAVLDLVFNVTNESINKVNGSLKALEDIVHKINGVLKSESGEAIGEELAGFIVRFVDEVKKVLVHVEVILKTLRV